MSTTASIDLSELRDGITGSGAGAKTLADIVVALEAVESAIEALEIGGGGGTPGAVTLASITRPSNTTAYTALDVVGASPAANMTFLNVLATAGSTFAILGARLRIDASSVPAGMLGFRLHIYGIAPTAIADNTAYNLPSGDRSKYLGYIGLPLPDDLGATLWSQADGVNFTGKLAAESTTLYGILQTLGSYTPVESTMYTVTLVAAAL